MTMIDGLTMSVPAVVVSADAEGAMDVAEERGMVVEQRGLMVEQRGLALLLLDDPVGGAGDHLQRGDEFLVARSRIFGELAPVFGRLLAIMGGQLAVLGGLLEENPDLHRQGAGPYGGRFAFRMRRHAGNIPLSDERVNAGSGK